MPFIVEIGILEDWFEFRFRFEVTLKEAAIADDLPSDANLFGGGEGAHANREDRLEIGFHLLEDPEALRRRARIVRKLDLILAAIRVLDQSERARPVNVFLLSRRDLANLVALRRKLRDRDDEIVVCQCVLQVWMKC